MMITDEGANSLPQESHLEANKIVEINRMLADDQYSIGKNVAEFKFKFESDLQKDDTPELQHYMNRICTFTSEVHVMIRKEGNLGGEKMRNWLAMGSFVVERYIFNTVYKSFFGAIQAKYGEKDQKFITQSELFKEKSAIALLDNLEIKPKFRDAELEKEELIYADAILELLKLDLCKSPKDKLDCLIMMNSMMRAFVI